MSRLDPRDEALAARVAELILEQRTPRGPRSLMTSREVAAYLRVDAEFVRDHADELGVLRLGPGKRPRLRFRPETVEAFIVEANAPKAAPARRRRQRRKPGTEDVVELLPVRGDAP